MKNILSALVILSGIVALGCLLNFALDVYYIEKITALGMLTDCIVTAYTICSAVVLYWAHLEINKPEQRS